MAGLFALVAALLPLAGPTSASAGGRDHRHHQGVRQGVHRGDHQGDHKRGHDGHKRRHRRGAPYVPPEGGHFNIPTGNREQQSRIERTVLDAIHHARPGSYIKIALFSFDRRPMGDALIKAYHRGVHVQLLLNDHQVTRTMRTMKGVFHANRDRKSFIYQCNRGCRGGSFLHSKLYVFSHTGGATHGTVMLGSTNLTTNAMVHQWNDLLVLNKAKVYKVANRVFDQMKADKKAHPVYHVWHISSRYELQAFPHPHTTKKNDPIMQILSGVHCKGATRHTGTHGHTKIRVDMHRWSDHRGSYIAHRLIKLYGEGCDVKLMHGSADDTVRAAMRTRTHRGMVPLRTNGFDENGDGELDRYTHHKYMTISGNYGGDHSTSLLLTGSSNWAGIGVTGDEILFLARGRSYVRQWNHNWNYIWAHGSKPVTYRRPGHFDVFEPKATGKYWEND
ncbi:MAG: hypothetical protein QOK15_1098 [Nocardioidaceae bacterium]|nr:hypothetical protein [Nocardioidaceae bacterium]